MRPSTTTSAAVGSAQGGFWHWNSPVAYVFVGLAFMLGLITVALIILACSNIKSSTSEAEDEIPARQLEIQVESEPKIVVIMAGDDNPTYLARPVSCNCPSEQFKLI
ncbi:protein GLUTAMINE DUMPER [Salix suchowensis]|nr:protein GLUTAMINE DUMPER [Salix suchowensis]